MRAEADYARQSWPDENRQFRRRWIEQPRPERPAEAPKNFEHLAAAVLSDWRRTREA